MSEVQQSTFVITREGRIEEAKTVVREGLMIGRLRDSDLSLIHPAVSRLHAGISWTKGSFYLINLSASSPTALNGRPVPFNDAEALTVGDEIQIGPFLLYVDEADEENETLRIRVARQYALTVAELESRRASEDERRRTAAGQTAGAPDALKIFWSARTRERAARPSPLHPKPPPLIGKERFNWTPTRDLVRPWTVAVFTLAVVAVGALSAGAAIVYKTFFAPAPVSAPHARKNFASSNAVAALPSEGSCTSCHVIGVSLTNRERVNENCAACHRTEAFSATVIRAHRDAGITCTDCHAEHGGGDFSPTRAGREACAKCHSDANKSLYNGKGVHTPHGGTYGYPVVNGVWVWKGLGDEELAERPEIGKLLKDNRVAPADTRRWRRVQFHGLHNERVRAYSGAGGVPDAEGAGEVLSCRSCHKSGYGSADVDRIFPRMTCGRCHNTRIFEGVSTPTAADTPSCSSCHVEHVKDFNRASSLLRAGLTVPTFAVEK